MYLHTPLAAAAASPSNARITQHHGQRYRQVVQRRQGIWLHLAGRRERGCLRALFRDQRQGLPLAEGRPARELRGHPGPEGCAGLQYHAAGLILPRISRQKKKPRQPAGFFYACTAPAQGGTTVTWDGRATPVPRSVGWYMSSTCGGGTV